MTYPKVSQHQRRHGVASSPRFPALEESVLSYWKADGTFQASIDRRDAEADGERVRVLRRPALRQRAAALRPPAHRLRQGPDPALPDDARQARRAPLRLGHPRPARRARGDAPARPQDHRRDPRARHREVQRRLPRVGAEVHRRVARLRHPPGALGRLRERLQDDEPRLHGVGHVGLQAAARQGLHLRGLPRPALLLERRDAAVQPRAADGRRRLQDAPGPGRHGRLRVDDRGAAGAQVLVWTTTPWTLPSNLAVMVGPDIDYVVVESDLPPAAPSATSSAPSGWRRTPGARRATPRSWRGSRAPTCRPRPTPRRSATTSATRTPSASCEADFVTTTDGTGLVHSAGAFGEDDKVVTDREGIEAVMPVGKDGRFTARSTEYAGMLVFDANLQSSTTSRRHRGEARVVTPGTVLLRRETYDHSYPHCWRCREPSSTRASRRGSSR